MQETRKLVANTAKPNSWMNLFDPPSYSSDTIGVLLKELYGLSVDCVPLTGERDQNLLLRADGKPWAVLKISHPNETETYIDYQAELLQHLLEFAPDLPVPRIFPTANGAYYSYFEFPDGRSCAVKVVTFLEGLPLLKSKTTIETWAHRVGKMQAKICLALEGFDHPGANDFSPWNATSSAVLDDQILPLMEPDFLDLLAPEIERLRSVSLPRIRQMRSQIIHNDFHNGNILLDEKQNISGIIDFGDAVFAPIIQDVAVAAVSLIEMAPDAPVDALSYLVAGFRSVYPLSSEELSALHDTMLLRSMLNVALGHLKDQGVPADQRPRTATQVSRKTLLKILSLKATEFLGAW